MDDMIRQVALLTEMMKEIQKNRARSELNENREEAKGVREAEGEEPSNVEEKSEALPEKQRKEETVEIESEEKETLAKEESITTPPDNKALKEILEETNDEPQKKEEEVIKCGAEVDNTLFYLKSEKVQVPNEKVKEFTTAVKGENTLTKRPPPVIDKSEGCCHEGEPELKKERPRGKAARSVYWVQLQTWPESLRAEKPSDPGLRPKENKKIQGTYKNHKKKRGAMTMVCPKKKNQWLERRKVNSGALVEDNPHRIINFLK